MQTVTELRDFWEYTATPEAKHHAGDLEPWFEFIDETFLPYLSEAEPAINSVIDWGCGQGGVSLRLAKRGFEVHAVDLVEESLRRARTRLRMHGHAMASTNLVGNPSALTLPMEQVDALFCMAVVQHFPSYGYWCNVAARWRKLAPKMIVLQTRHKKEGALQVENYRKDYIHALWLSTDAVLGQFPEYDVVFHHVDTADDHLWNAVSHYEFFVLRRKEGV